MNTRCHSFYLATRLAASRQNRAFTLIELLTVVALIGVLAAIAFPAISYAREAAKGSRCVSNLRQSGIAIQAYVSDNSGLLPPVGHPTISAYFNADPRNFQFALLPYLDVAPSTSWNTGSIEGQSHSPTFECPGFKGNPGQGCFGIQSTVTNPEDGSTLTPWARMTQKDGQFVIDRKATKHLLVPSSAPAIVDHDLNSTEPNHRGYQNTLHFDWSVSRGAVNP